MKWTLDRAKDVLFWGVVSAVSAALADILGFPCCFTAFAMVWITSAGTCLFLSSLQVSVAGKAVLITGCDTGFGLHLAFHLHQMGFRVFAGCLMADSGGSGAEQLRREGTDRIHVLQLDVTDQEQVKNALQQVKNILPKGEVFWGVVNNAGLSTFGEVEWVSIEVYKKIAQVNVFGLISTTKAFLPLIRHSKGRVVNIASMLGRMALPMRSPYVATKYAVEGFSDCLRHEMRPWGVKVSIIEPGNFVAATSIFTDESVKRQADAMWASMDEDLQIDVGREYFDGKVNLMMSYTNVGITDVSPAIEAMTEALMHKFPRSRYQPMELYNWVRIFVYTHLPEYVYDNLYIH